MRLCDPRLVFTLSLALVQSLRFHRLDSVRALGVAPLREQRVATLFRFHLDLHRAQIVCRGGAGAPRPLGAARQGDNVARLHLTELDLRTPVLHARTDTIRHRRAPVLPPLVPRTPHLAEVGMGAALLVNLQRRDTDLRGLQRVKEHALLRERLLLRSLELLHGAALRTDCCNDAVLLRDRVVDERIDRGLACAQVRCSESQRAGVHWRCLRLQLRRRRRGRRRRIARLRRRRRGERAHSGQRAAQAASSLAAAATNAAAPPLVLVLLRVLVVQRRLQNLDRFHREDDRTRALTLRLRNLAHARSGGNGGAALTAVHRRHRVRDAASR